MKHIPESFEYPSEGEYLDLDILDDGLIGTYEVIENDDIIVRRIDGTELLPDIDTPNRTSPIRDLLTADKDENVGLALDDVT